MTPRVLHLAMIDWRDEDGIARSAAAVAARLGGEQHLVANRPPGRAAAAFDSTTIVEGTPASVPFGAGFAAALATVDPDVVHVHGGLLAPAVALAPALRHRCVVASVYHAPELPSPDGGVRAALGTLGAHRSSSVVPWRAAAMRAAGPSTARRLLRSGRLAAVASPIPEVVRSLEGSGRVALVRGAACCGPRRARWSDTPTVVFAGKAERARGVDVLLEAFAAVRRSVPAARLRLALLPGAAADLARRHAADPAAGIDLTVGPVPDLAELLAGAQVAAYPFRWSATMTPPLAAAEAMAAGVPVVGTTAACLRDLVHDGLDGRVVAPGDPSALAAALVDVLSEEPRWNSLSRGATETIEARWCWDRAAARIAELHHSLLLQEDAA